MRLDLDRKIAGRTVRFWGLALNLVGNVLLLHGAVRYLAGASMIELAVGAGITGVCIAVLSVPSK